MSQDDTKNCGTVPPVHITPNTFYHGAINYLNSSLNYVKFQQETQSVFMQFTNFKQSKTSIFTPVFLLFISIVPLSRGTADGITLILLTWKIWWALNNASRWQMGFNSAFKWLIIMTSFRSKTLYAALKIN